MLINKGGHCHGIKKWSLNRRMLINKGGRFHGIKKLSLNRRMLIDKGGHFHGSIKAEAAQMTHLVTAEATGCGEDSTCRIKDSSWRLHSRGKWERVTSTYVYTYCLQIHPFTLTKSVNYLLQRDLAASP